MKITTVNVWVAVKGRNISGVKLHHVQIDGNRPTLGHRIGGGNALVYMGGDASGQQVTYTKISHTRTWSSLHFQEGDNKLCSGATVSNNTIGPAGCDKDRNGCAAGDATKSWADGISLACKNSTVSGDTITDATDGSIVIFGAPGSSVTSNTIEASTRILLGGINLVDCDPFFYNDGTFKGGDYSNVTVSSNTIKATGKRIDVGIGQGPYVWGGFTSCPCGDTNNRNKNAMVRNNTLPQSANFGYGYVVDGVQGWTTFGNGSNATHSGSADDCASGSASATAKLKHSGHSSGTWCDSQGQQCDVYTEGVAHGVLASN